MGWMLHRAGCLRSDGHPAPTGSGPVTAPGLWTPCTACSTRKNRKQQAAATHWPSHRCSLSAAAAGRTDMAWFVMVIGMAVLLRVDGTAQVLKEDKEMQGSLDRDIEEQIILGIRAIEPPVVEEKSDIDPGMRLLSPDGQGGSAAWSTGAPPALLGAKSTAVPEEDRDHIYHPPADALEVEAPVQTAALYEEVLSGPEEDRDHLYHS